MPRLKAKNNARTQLAEAIDNIVDSFTVVDGSVLPDPPFKVTIEDEIMEVQAKSGNTLSNVLRGQEGTTSASHASGAYVEHRWTAGTHQELLDRTDDFTVDDTQTPSSNTGPIGTLFNFIANMLKSITGQADWKTAPTKNLKELDTALTSHEADNATNPSGNQIFHVEVVSSFPAHADGKVIFHTGEGKFFGSANGEWV